MTKGAEGTGYTLTLSEAEVGRYRLMAQRAKESESDLWELAGIRPGARVGDIGCGPGAMIPVIADIVGPSGAVIAVDGDESAVAAAKALVEAAGVPNATVSRGRADDTGIEPGSLDVVMMRHVLAHNGPAEQRIVDHLASLIRPGGSVYLVDVFLPAMAVRPDIAVFTEMSRRYAEFHAQRGNDLCTGLRLDQLLAAAGLETRAYRGDFLILTPPPGLRPPVWAAREQMREAGVIDDADIARWDAALTEYEAKPPTLFNPLFYAVGTKP